MTAAPTIAIVFNAYEPRPTEAAERLSEESVAEMARQAQDAVLTLGLGVTLIPLQRSLLNFLGRVREVNPDALINLCEGYYGRPQWESNVAGIFELLGLGFTGSPAKTLAFCQDKFKAKAVLRAAGLPTAPAQLMIAGDEPLELRFPLIVKPNAEDASLGIYPHSVVRDETALRQQVRRCLDNYRQPVLVEAFIDGREFNVSVLDDGEVKPLPVSEIDFSAMPKDLPRILGYEAKWFEDNPLYKKTPPICPAPVDDELRTKLQGLAAAAFRTMGCRDYARVDFRMDAKGRPFILEVNPNPDISINAGYARALKAAGIEYAAFWGAMVRNALARKVSHDPADAGAR
ncbi:MAG TPA: ATP-grasp domain-containing protein [Candidatus Aminicenantes bacterium]|nr:ATP-grasp domain-containing protein [Candidatus Aminicenantes bacterium]HRY64270.1 ATP-grasp domain-containing protein [Candidatus Aminicenantes bacterium]HRZ71183.1 ATP-grasp domain-containing protein [Candidatus Aminicenantes bacterium]